MTPAELAALQARAYRHQSPWTAADFEALLDHPTTRLFLAGHGFLLVRFIADEGEILALATDPAQQRTGVASGLMQDLHASAKAEGITSLFIEVSAKNGPAQAFYARHDYTEAGRRPGYYRQPDGSRTDAVLLVRTDAATEAG